jgi:starch synthase
LLRSVPTVISKLPDTRFLLLLIPIHQTDLIYKVVYEAAKYIDNVRVIFGKSKLFQLSYLSTDTYAMPSRWEPFGIAALEAMVCGAPVVGAGVGGLRETVLDIHEHREKATGMLIPPESPEALAEGLTNLLLIMKVDELACKGLNGEAKRYIDLITEPQISKIVLNQLKARLTYTEQLHKKSDQLLPLEQRCGDGRTLLQRSEEDGRVQSMGVLPIGSKAARASSEYT